MGLVAAFVAYGAIRDQAARLSSREADQSPKNRKIIAALRELVKRVAPTRGATLDDPRELLEGKAQHVRHIKVRAVDDIDEKSFAALLRQAAK